MCNYSWCGSDKGDTVILYGIQSQRNDIEYEFVPAIKLK